MDKVVNVVNDGVVLGFSKTGLETGDTEDGYAKDGVSGKVVKAYREIVAGVVEKPPEHWPSACQIHKTHSRRDWSLKTVEGCDWTLPFLHFTYLVTAHISIL